jgi:hypothetical protein
LELNFSISPFYSNLLRSVLSPHSQRSGLSIRLYHFLSKQLGLLSASSFAGAADFG